jgi:hypothetical protein
MEHLIDLWLVTVNGIQYGWPSLSNVISPGNWWIIKSGIYVSKEK